MELLTLIAVVVVIFLLSHQTTVSNNGYVVNRQIFRKPRYQHRRVAEKVLGRKLKPDEVVHHINGRRWDNRVENLCVMNASAHLSYHDWYSWIYDYYGNYPRRETQLRKLRESFGGTLLAHVGCVKSDEIQSSGPAAYHKR